MVRIASGLVRLSRSLLPRTSRFQASKRAPRNSSSSSLSAWIIVPMAPSSTRMRWRASVRSSDSMGESVGTEFAIGSEPLLPLPGEERAVQVLHHIIVPKSQHEIATRFEHGSTHGVSFRVDRMLTSVKLDDQSSILAAEIRDIAIDWHLALEFPSA